ncbi:cytokine receptor common subunit beta isoform X1 [Pelobates cultripes]|uniref:Cytokine receptor common subunit beta isoform X1 n=1 Tax=Pelobates cultripes TaxID=61616 RepID=A0AAD1RKZ4_PELCU|nr:cytokine receptor common subunit beta isoform X1 [Pelobates cultripes]
MNAFCSTTTLCYIVFHLLYAVKGTVLINSLECYTDFKSEESCTWTVSRRSMKFVKMSLCYGDDEKKCNICQDPEVKEDSSPFSITLTCKQNLKKIFTLNTKLIHSFLSDQNLDIQLNLSGKDALQEEQHKPELYSTDETHFLHLSDIKYLFQTHQSAEILQCEVQYRRELETWENSLIGECKDSWASISIDHVSGDRYFARMRLKTSISQESWGNWSSEILLESKKPGDEAKPQNLHCFLHPTNTLICSWAVRVEVLDSVTFKMVYTHDESLIQEECHPKCVEMPHNLPYLSCSCNITSASPLSVVSVQPKQEFKSFNACARILLPPTNMSVEEVNNGKAYNIRWNKKTQGDGHRFKLHFQLCYWSDYQQLDKNGESNCSTNSKYIEPNYPSALVLSLGTDLEPRRTYYAKIRMRVMHNQEKENECYVGPWGEWSSVQTWKTKSVIPIWLILAIIIPCCVVLIICGAFGIRYLARFKKKWEDQIPNPNKSFLIVNFHHKMERSAYIFPKHHLYEEMFNSCNAIHDSSPIVLNNAADCKQDDEKPGTTHGQCHENKIYCLTPEILENTKDEISLVEGSGYQAFSDLVNDANDTDLGNASVALYSFDGPYLLCPSNPGDGSSSAQHIH